MTSPLSSTEIAIARAFHRAVCKLSSPGSLIKTREDAVRFAATLVGAAIASENPRFDVLAFEHSARGGYNGYVVALDTPRGRREEFKPVQKSDVRKFINRKLATGRYDRGFVADLYADGSRGTILSDFYRNRHTGKARFDNRTTERF